MASPAVYVGTITIKDGVPQCPECLRAMIDAGVDQHPSGTEIQVFRCGECGAEFPPAEAREASKAAWRIRAARRRASRTWVVIGVLLIVVLAAARVWQAVLVK